MPGREGGGTGYLGKAVLPDPSSLAADYTDKTLIGDFVRGVKDGKEHEILIYNIADHAEAYREVGSQAISYTAGVPAAAAAILIASGEWESARWSMLRSCRHGRSSGYWAAWA